ALRVRASLAAGDTVRGSRRCPMTRVLVSAASKHGATAEIAAEIARELWAAGVETELLAPEAVQTLDGVDACVLGSGVYAGHWLKPAKAVVERHGEALRTRPV